MIPADFIAEWRDQVQWVQSSQVEQDLVISRAFVEIFADAVAPPSLSSSAPASPSPAWK